jgi:hypothetical protein
MMPRRLGLASAVLGVVAAAAGCGAFSDAATRLAEDVGDGAGRLRRSTVQESAVVHVPRAHPEGCSGAYQVTFQESLHHPNSGGSILVGCVGSTNFVTVGYSYSTTSHLNYVRVPKELRIEKQAGVPLTVMLRKASRTIDVVDLK